VFPCCSVSFLSLPQTETLPEAGPPEAAFVGRSNVGKSSLVNMVVGRRAMAYTSKTPGKTQQFNYFNVNGESTFDEPKGEFNLVDLPGVGYAKVPKRVRDEWAKFMTDYFYTRPTLKVRTLCLSLKSLPRSIILVEMYTKLEMP